MIRRAWSPESDHVQGNAEKVRGGSGQHKQMPEGVHVADAFFPIEENTAGIEDAAQKQQDDAVNIQGLHQRDHGGDDAPAADHISRHGNFFEAFDTDGVEHDAHNRHRPYHTEDGPANGAPQRDQGIGGISAGDEQKNRGMIKHPQYLFGAHIGDGVVQARHGEQQNHTGSVDGGADELPGIAAGTYQQEYGADDGQKGAGTVGNGIGNLFADGVKGPFSHNTHVCQLRYRLSKVMKYL